MYLHILFNTKFLLKYFSLPILFILGLTLIQQEAAAQASARPQLTMSVDIDGGGFKPAEWPYEIEGNWTANSEGGLEFQWVIDLQAPNDLEILSVQAKKSDLSVRRSKKNMTSSRVLSFGMRSVSDEMILFLESNKMVQIKLTLNFKETIIIENGCKELNLHLSSLPKTVIGSAAEKNRAIDKAVVNQGEEIANLVGRDPASSAGGEGPPYYFAYHCERISSGIRLAVTVPDEVKWISNALFESKGKGRNWRNFDLGVQLSILSRQDLGLLEFEWQGENYAFAVLVEKMEIARPISQFYFSFGSITLNSKTSDKFEQQAKLATGVGFELRPWDGPWSFGGQGLTVVPSANINGYFYHTETMGYVGYTLIAKPHWYFEPRVGGFVANGAVQSMNQFYISNTVIVGGTLRIKFNQRDHFTVEGHLMPQASDSVLSIRAIYLRKNPNQIGGWGVLASYQQLGMNLKAAAANTANQIFVAPYIEF